MKTSNPNKMGKDPGAIRIALGRFRFAPKLPDVPELAPTREILDMWQVEGSREKYDHHMKQRLDALDPQGMWDRLHEMVAPHEPILLCHCAAAKVFCHRRMVAEWFEDAGLGPVHEVDYEGACPAYADLPNEK